MSHTSPSMPTRPSALRRWATRATVAAAGAGLVAGLAAPAASAAPEAETKALTVACRINHDVRIGPVFGGYTEGNCRTQPGMFYRGIGGTPDRYSLGQVFLPGGASYSAWVDKIW
ncbi:hypothetical protein [Corynebacterium kalidii]|uniref:Uncharacterized protein n=1 Tax=Corynebacterium kalidii TaxID=2931982 RepID=A0A9X1WE17_9CORY|nr:hypothetical protein [Corynebacterium kalidii]MCJ7857299.1 hypothetical protein [Corynebacterium kalidii]